MKKELKQPLLETDEARDKRKGKNDYDSVSSKQKYSPLQDNDEKKDDEKTDEKKIDPSAIVPFSSLFRFSSCGDRMLMVIGILAAMVNGAGLPAFSVIFGQMLNDFNTSTDIVASISQASILFCIIGGVMFVCSWITMGIWLSLAEEQAKKCREQYLASVLKQDIAWFDAHTPGELSTALANDSEAFKKAIGEKVPMAFQFTTTFFGGLAVGFVKGWQLACILIGITPILGACAAFLMKFIAGSFKANQEAYSKAGSVAEETLAGIRTVNALGIEEVQVERYAQNLGDAKRAGKKKSVLQGFSTGLTNLLVFGAYGLCLWFGVWLIRNDIENWYTGESWTGGDVMSVFFALIMGAFSLGMIAPSFESFAAGRAAAYRLYEVIDRVPTIDSSDERGHQAGRCGDIHFDNIHFSYPTRSDVTIFKDFTLHVKAGQTVAIVGESGSGKSTIVGLLERFYDPSAGRITVDKVDLKELNLRWWRDQVGVVRQEPVLNDASILDNIKMGKPWATDDEVMKAAQAAGAHDFIETLPEKYHSMVGEGGTLLSGGQKQRIALARAIIRDPKVLLLDEATSALDNETERLVQKSLDKLMKGRTTLMIAHRLSTVVNADVIHVLHQGTIVESGTHQELMTKEGVYYNLVQAQGMHEDEKKELKLDGPLQRQASAGKIVTLVRSKSALGKQEEEEDEKDVKYEVVPAGRVFDLAAPTRLWLFLGFIGATIVGGAMPLWSIIFSQLTNVMYQSDPDQQQKDSFFWAMMFLVLGAGMCIGNLSEMIGFGFAGEYLTELIRRMTFSSLIRQELGWFDLKKHNSRALGTRLATDASLVQDGTTKRAGQTVQMLIALTSGLTISFYHSWQVALVVLSTLPIMVIASGIQWKKIAELNQGEKKAYERAGIISGEAIANIHTVYTFNDQPRVLGLYSNALAEPAEIGKKAAHTTGLGFGFNNLVMFGIYGLCWWYGATRVANHGLPFDKMMTAVMAIVMAGMGVGQAANMVPNLEAATRAKDAIFQLIDRVPLINSADPSGDKVQLPKGRIVFKNVKFEYPSRPKEVILKSFDAVMEGGNTVAIVGSSGSGKSTIMWLLLRLYDVSQGSIEIDGYNINKQNIKNYRSQIGFVGQEPMLFDTTIRENVRYGKPDATMDEIIAACRAANIHDWIMTQPSGYETQVGAHGSKLSGGQKQRVAIARALVRNPRVLLLDEATSALDTENERVVQQALDQLMADKSRTTVVIAHRLSTVINADKIIVLQNGVVAEAGTHTELMSLRGAYFHFASAGMSSSSSE